MLKKKIYSNAVRETQAFFIACHNAKQPKKGLKRGIQEKSTR